MARPARLEIAGAVYLIGAHCPFESGQPAFVDDTDRAEMRALLAQALHRCHQSGEPRGKVAVVVGNQDAHGYGL